MGGRIQRKYGELSFVHVKFERSIRHVSTDVHWVNECKNLAFRGDIQIGAYRWYLWL